MIFSGIVTILAFVMLGRAATKVTGTAPLMAAGLVALGLSVLLHALRFEPTPGFFVTTAAEYGIGCLLLAGLLFKHKRASGARSWFLMGSVLLTAVVGILAFQRVSDAVSVEWLLELGPDDHLYEVQPVLDRYGLTAERAFPTITRDMNEDLSQVHILRGPKRAMDQALRQLTQDVENVDHMEPNLVLDFLDPVAVVPADRTPLHGGETVLENDPLISEQWGLVAVRGHEAHEILKHIRPAYRARVAVLDTGVDGRHEDLEGVFGASPAATDLHGHGSHVAGLAGAATNNGVGVASLNWEGRFVEVVGYKALESNGTGSLELIAQAVIDATHDKADVISMSLGAKLPQTPKIISDAIKYALDANIIVVVSAGNAGEDAADHMPSNVPGVIVVSAVDEALRKARFSNTNTSLDRPVTAPGVNMLSLAANGAYVRMSGTSMSTPVVSGLLGVMRSLDPGLSADHAWTILQQTGHDVVDTAQIGRLIDAEAAISAVRGRAMPETAGSL